MVVSFWFSVNTASMRTPSTEDTHVSACRHGSSVPEACFNTEHMKNGIMGLVSHDAFLDTNILLRQINRDSDGESRSQMSKQLEIKPPQPVPRRELPDTACTCLLHFSCFIWCTEPRTSDTTSAAPPRCAAAAVAAGAVWAGLHLRTAVGWARSAPLKALHDMDSPQAMQVPHPEAQLPDMWSKT